MGVLVGILLTIAVSVLATRHYAKMPPRPRLPASDKGRQWRIVPSDGQTPRAKYESKRPYRVISADDPYQVDVMPCWTELPNPPRKPDKQLDHSLVHLDSRGAIAKGIGIERRARGGDAGACTGDVDFDKRVSVTGPAVQALAVLTAESRARLPDLLAAGRHCTVANGDVRVRSNKPFRTKAEVGRYVQVAREIADLLASDPLPLEDRLAERFATEPMAPVRWELLRFMEQDFPESAAFTRALDRAVRDDSPRTRLLAARRLEVDGVGAAISVVDDRRSTEEQLREAAELVARWAPPARRSEQLWLWLEHEKQSIREKSIELLVGDADRAAVERMLQTLSRDDGAAKRLASYVPDSLHNLEEVLLELLDWDEEIVATAAAQRLELVGSRTAVAPLLERAESGGRALRATARAAIRAIQARLGEQAGGNLSLAVRDAGGEVTLAQSGGELSTPEDEVGLPDSHHVIVGPRSGSDG